jgi:AcrR family transcriptional regulator
MALAGFGRRGFEGTAISEIAAAVGVSKAAVSFHFASKDDIAHALADPVLDELDAVLDRHPRPVWPSGALALAGEYFDTLVQHRDVVTWLDGDKSIQARPEWGGRMATQMERLVSAFTGSDRDPAGRARALAAIGGIWRPLRVMGAEELLEHRDSIVRAALISYAPLDVEPVSERTPLAGSPDGRPSPFSSRL